MTAPAEVTPEEFVDDGVESGQRAFSEEVGVDGFEGVEGFALGEERRVAGAHLNC